VSQRYWEDVKDGETLPGFALELTMSRMVQQVSGTQDFYPVHHDRDFARSGGHPDIFVNTAFTRGALCRLLTDWVGPTGFVKRLGFQMRRYHLLGDTMHVRGKVVKKYREAGAGAVDLEIWAENAREGIATPGTATVHLPRRSP
jgi:acyl dehydratase